MILIVLAVAAFIAWLIFRPMPKIDNSIAQGRLDSALRIVDSVKAWNDSLVAAKNRNIDSLTKINDTLLDQTAQDRDKIDAALGQSSKWHKQYLDAKAKGDTATTDSICEIVMSRFVMDSMQISDLIEHSRLAEQASGMIVANYKQIVMSQTALIHADSTALSQSVDLNKTQAQQIKKLENKVGIGKGVIIGLGVLAAILAIK